MKKPIVGVILETQEGISAWAEQTFGPAGSNARVAARANEEMAELLRALTADEQSPKAPEEIADVVIVLYRLGVRLGVELSPTVDPAWFNLRVANSFLAILANAEMARLLVCIGIESSETSVWLVGVVRLLACLAVQMGTDLQTEIDAKMKKNRQRVWKLDGTGHGYHVREKG